MNESVGKWWEMFWLYTNSDMKRGKSLTSLDRSWCINSQKLFNWLFTQANDKELPLEGIMNIKYTTFHQLNGKGKQQEPKRNLNRAENWDQTRIRLTWVPQAAVTHQSGSSLTCNRWSESDLQSVQRDFKISQNNKSEYFTMERLHTYVLQCETSKDWTTFISSAYLNKTCFN